MRKLSTLLFLAIQSLTTWAYNFQVDQLCYNILSETEVEVTYQQEPWSGDPAYPSLAGNVTIPSTVTYNGNSYTVTGIGNDAFIYCSSLTSVTITTSVISIGSSAFWGCSSLSSITIPNSVTSIESHAFAYCISLSSITIPTSVTSIGDAFSVCISLTNIHVESGNLSYSSENGVLFNADKTTLVRYPEGKTETTYIIPTSVTSIEDNAFDGCRALASVTIGSAILNVGWGAFSGCSSLTNIHVESGNLSYSSENGVLFNADKTTLMRYPEGKTETTYTIPTSVTSIGDYAFGGCSSLSSVTIPTSVTSIGDNAFDGCRAITSFTIPNSVTSIGHGAFWYCSTLTSVTIPTSVTSIESDAFFGTALYWDLSNWVNNVLYIDNCLINAKSELSGAYDIAVGTRVIADGAFYGCSSLTFVIIPTSVTNIGNNAFFNCSSLTGMTVLATIPPAADIDAFKKVDRDIPLYVPAASIETYRTADVWKEFTNILPLEALTHKKLEITITGNGTIQYGETTLTKDTALYIVPETQTALQLLPAEGYAITQVLYNGTDYTSNVTADGTVTLPAMTENGILSVQFDVPLYTIAYYVEGSDAYFENDVINGDNFTLRVKPHTGKTIRTVTLNGQNITNQMQEDGTIELIAIDQDMILIVTCTTTGEPTDFTTQTSYHLRAWQANGTIFAEVDDNVAILQLYDVSGRLMNEHRHNGNYQVITLPAPNEVNILKVVGKDGSITAHKLM